MICPRCFSEDALHPLPLFLSGPPSGASGGLAPVQELGAVQTLGLAQLREKV